MDKKATTNCRPSEQNIHLQYHEKGARERSQDIQMKRVYNFIFRFYSNHVFRSGSEARRFFVKKSGEYIYHRIRLERMFQRLRIKSCR